MRPVATPRVTPAPPRSTSAPPLVAALLASHLLLDGGPVFLLAPGFGVTFATTISLGASPTNVGLSRPTPELRAGSAVQGPATYPLFDGYGVLSLFVFAVSSPAGGSGRASSDAIGTPGARAAY